MSLEVLGGIAGACERHNTGVKDKRNWDLDLVSYHL